VIDVFISHSSQDTALAEQLVELLRSALNLRAEQIRCTSVDGYRLPAGADSDERLRAELLEAKAFVGVLSPLSLASAYVLFELGARWGAKKHLAPLLTAGMTANSLRGPIAGLNALTCESPGQLHQLVRDIGEVLGVESESPAVYQGKIDALVYSGADVREQPQSAQPVPAVSGITTGQASGPSISASIEAGTEYADADVVIRRHCEREWPEDFSMRAYCMRQQREAILELQRGGPPDLPDVAFRSIRDKCALEWPDDYSMRLYCEQQQIQGYREISES
jgi:hypothetical protein